jgi:hypothetical protein
MSQPLQSGLYRIKYAGAQNTQNTPNVGGMYATSTAEGNVVVAPETPPFAGQQRVRTLTLSSSHVCSLSYTRFLV